MKLFVFALVAACLVLEAVKCSNFLEVSGIPAEERRRCGKQYEPCSRGSIGNEHPKCCHHYKCSCNIASQVCVCIDKRLY
uniref:U24-Deinotoxin-Dsu1c_1 n=1 Tax=Deinopis subrufa TaxID=1905329 RepID=A0A4Q8K910_DEISU